MIDFDGLAIGPCIDAFGQPALYRPGAGAPVAFNGIFNRYATDEKITDTGEMRQQVMPTIGLRVDDLQPGAPLPCRGEIVEVGGIIWQIAEPVLDGFGHITLKLKEVM